MKKLSAFFLLLGLFFSVFFIRASWSATETVIEYKPRGLSNLFMIGGGSDHQYVTTSFIGYIFLIMFGLMNRQTAITTGVNRQLNMFFRVTIACLVFELTSWVLMYYGVFHGIHLRIGALLVLFGLWLWDRMYNARK